MITSARKLSYSLGATISAQLIAISASQFPNTKNTPEVASEVSGLHDIGLESTLNPIYLSMHLATHLSTQLQLLNTSSARALLVGDLMVDPGLDESRVWGAGLRARDGLQTLDISSISLWGLRLRVCSLRR